MTYFLTGPYQSFRNVSYIPVDDEQECVEHCNKQQNKFAFFSDDKGCFCVDNRLYIAKIHFSKEHLLNKSVGRGYNTCKYTE